MIPPNLKEEFGGAAAIREMGQELISTCENASTGNGRTTTAVAANRPVRRRLFADDSSENSSSSTPDLWLQSKMTDLLRSEKERALRVWGFDITTETPSTSASDFNYTVVNPSEVPSFYTHVRGVSTMATFSPKREDRPVISILPISLPSQTKNPETAGVTVPIVKDETTTSSVIVAPAIASSSSAIIAIPSKRVDATPRGKNRGNLNTSPQISRQSRLTSKYVSCFGVQRALAWTLMRCRNRVHDAASIVFAVRMDAAGLKIGSAFISHSTVSPPRLRFLPCPADQSVGSRTYGAERMRSKTRRPRPLALLPFLLISPVRCPARDRISNIDRPTDRPTDEDVSSRRAWVGIYDGTAWRRRMNAGHLIAVGVTRSVSLHPDHLNIYIRYGARITVDARYLGDPLLDMGRRVSARARSASVKSSPFTRSRLVLRICAVLFCFYGALIGLHAWKGD